MTPAGEGGGEPALLVLWERLVGDLLDRTAKFPKRACDPRSQGPPHLPPTLPVWFEQALVALPAKVVPLTHEIAFQGEALPAFHGDPADRFHVATALVNGYRLMTVDGKIEAWAKKGPGKALGLTLV